VIFFHLTLAGAFAPAPRRVSTSSYYYTRRNVLALSVSKLDAASSRHGYENNNGNVASKTKHTLLSSNILQSLTMAVALALATPTMAAAAASPDAFIFNHEYADPLHPNCQRKIEVNQDGKSFHYSGTAVGPKNYNDPVLRGCTPKEIKEFGIRRGAFDGEIIRLPGGLQQVSAGDGVHEGVWEPAKITAASTDTTTDTSSTTTTTTNLGLAYEDVDGIRWNDGNKWIVQDKPQSAVVGERIFYAYIGFSTLAGVKGVVDGIQRRRQHAE
jgi:hypothetical protein